MNAETLKLLEQLAVKLGTTTEFLWATLVKQATVQAWSHLIILPVMGVLLFFSWKFWNKHLSESDEAAFFSAAALGILSLVYVCVAAAGSYDIITGFVNPDYYALKEVLGSLRTE